jgi:hypothetical protein
MSRICVNCRGLLAIFDALSTRNFAAELKQLLFRGCIISLFAVTEVM